MDDGNSEVTPDSDAPAAPRRDPAPHQVATGDLKMADRAKVHPLVRATAEWSWRLLLILFTVYVLGRLFLKFDGVLVPAAMAVLLSAFLVPVVDWLNRRRVPRSLAVIVTMLTALGVVAVILTFVGRAFVSGFPQLTQEVVATVDKTRNWLADGPLAIDETQVRHFGNNIVDAMEQNQAKLAGGAVATATTATEIVTGLLLMLFLMIFFLYGGGQIWAFCTRLIPKGSRVRVTEAGIAGFGTLVAYVRATVVVAAVDAICIGIGLAILHVPLALPLATLVFFFSFIPIVGALISGSLAVLVALVTQGWVTAVIVLALLIGVMQLEGHVLQPFLMGRSVRLHPVAVVMAIAAGLISAGIIGGLLAVPLIAFLNTAVRHLRGEGFDEVTAAGGNFEASPDPPIWDRRDLQQAVTDAEDRAEERDDTPPKAIGDTEDRAEKRDDTPPKAVGDTEDRAEKRDDTPPKAVGDTDKD